MGRIELTSSNGMTMYITPTKEKDCKEIKKIAEEAYNHWFACDDSDDQAWYEATGSYVIIKLEEMGYLENIDYTVEFGDDWD